METPRSPLSFGPKGGICSFSLSRGYWERALQIPPLRSPDFLFNLVALMNFMCLSLRRGAHVDMSGAAWQEIRVRFGRDDKGTAVLPGGIG